MFGFFFVVVVVVGGGGAEEREEKEEGFHAHGRDGREKREVDVLVKRAKKAIARDVNARI